MKKRVGNDLKMTWTILRSGEAEVFDNATNIKIYAYQINTSTSNIEVDFVRNSNVFSLNIPAESLNVGTYDLRLTYNKPDPDIEGGLGSYAIDEHEAFQIVKHTEAEDATGTDITGEVVYYHSSYVYIASASDTAGANFNYPANLSQDYIAILNSTIEIPEPSASDFEGLWFSKIAAYRAAVIGGYGGTEEQFYIDLALVSTKESVANKKQTVTNSETDYPSGKAVYDALALKENLLPATPDTPELKFLNGLKQWATIAIGAGGHSSRLYFTGIDSDISGYKKISNIADTNITELVSTITASEGEKFLRAYAYDDAIQTTIIDGGPWNLSFRAKVSNATGVTKMVVKVYVRSTLGAETLLFSADTSEINNTSYGVNVENSFPQGIFNVVATDRLVIKVYAKTTAASTITITTSIGDGDASYITTPLALRHKQLRDPNGDENYQHVTKEAQTFDGVKTFEDSPIVPTPTQNTEVANKKYVDDADALKVNKSDIANNLTTTTEGKVLDARQGKVLSDADATIIADEKAIVPSIAFYKRVLADSGTIGDKTILAKLFTDKLKSLSTTQVLYMPHLGLKERTSGVNKFASKVYDGGLSNIDAVQATEATQPFIGGFIAPNSLKGLKYVQGQTQTGEVAFTEKSYLATDSWSLTIVLKANKRAARVLLGASSYLEIGTSTITLHNGTTAILTATYSFDCGKTAIIGFHYANGLGLIKVDNVPLTTTTTSGVIAFSKMAYSSANPFDGLIYYFHLQNERISEAESQQNYTLLRALFPEIEGIAIGNQFWASSNYEGTVAGDGTIIPEVQLATSGEELVINGNFETNIERWVNVGACIVFERNTLTPIADTADFHIINNSATYSGAVGAGMVITAGKTYYITLKYRKAGVNSWIFAMQNSPNSVTGVPLAGYANQSLINTTNTELVYIFTARGSGTYYPTFLSYPNENSELWVDNISIKEAGWSDLAVSAFCYYNNDPKNGAVYGKQYNFPGITSLKNYPPKGYRVASYADWLQNSTYLGGNAISGRKLKKDGLVFWSTENTGTNESGFSAIGSGKRGADGAFTGLGTECNFWTSDGYLVTINNNANTVTFTSGADPKIGASVRLLRNSPVGDPRKQIESGYFTTNIASAAKSIAIPFGYVVKEIRITTTTNVTSIEAKLHNTAGTAVATLITGKACNATSTTFVVTADQATQLTDPTVRVTAAGNNATSIGMNITVIIEKIEL